MQINNGNEAILTEIDFLCDTSTTSYTTAHKIRNVNRWAYKAHVAMINGSRRWQIDDPNLTTLPHLTTTLDNGQEDYALPSGFLRVERVEVMNASGDYQQLQPMDHRDVKGGYKEFKETDGMPTHYDSVGGSIILHPAPATADVTTSEGLRVHILREIDIFTTADTTQEPGFPEPFHRIVTFGPASDYMMARGDMEKAQAYKIDAETLLGELSGFASEMGEEHVRIRPGHRTVNYL